MSIATEITRIRGAKADLKEAIESFDVEVPETAKIDQYKIYLNQGQATVEKLSNKVQTIDSASTAEQYPSAKAVFNAIGSEGSGSEKTINKTQTIDSASTEVQYPSAKAVFESNKLDEKVANKVDAISGAVDTNYPSVKAVKDYAEDKGNKVQTIDSASTAEQYPSAKAVFESNKLNEKVANKTQTIDSASTADQYPSAKAVFDANQLDEKVANKTQTIDSASTEVQYPSAKAVFESNKLDEKVANKVTAFDSGVTDVQYPSAKLVYDTILENEEVMSFALNDLNDRKENITNKTQTIDSASTETQYPSAKAVYDAINEGEGSEKTANKVQTIDSASTEVQYPSAKAVFESNKLDEKVANKVQTIDSASTETQYPSAKAVYDAINEGEGSEKTANKTQTIDSASTEIQYPSAKAVFESNKLDEKVANKVTAFTGSETDAQYPSAKLVYDTIIDNEEAIAYSLNDLNEKKENISNKVQTIDSASTETQYPSAKAVYDAISEGEGSEKTANKVQTIDSASTETQYPSAKAVYNLAETKGVNAYNYIKQLRDYLFEVQYSTENIDQEFCYKYFMTPASADDPDMLAGGHCTGVYHEGKVLRHYDWYYNNEVEFLVRRPSDKEAGKYGSIGIAAALPSLVKSFVKADKYSEKYRLVPFAMCDGVNEKGVFIQQNVVPKKSGDINVTHTSSVYKGEITVNMIIRIVLDNCKSVAEVATELSKYDIRRSPRMPEAYDSHFLIADGNGGHAILEFTQDGTSFNVVSFSRDVDAELLSNFCVDGTGSITEGTFALNWDVISDNSGNNAGLERWEIGAKYLQSPTSLNELREQLIYTKMYDASVNPQWYTEVVNATEGLTPALARQAHAGDAAAIAKFEAVLVGSRQDFADRKRETTGEHSTWQTVHSIVYDLKNLTMDMVIQERMEDVLVKYLDEERIESSDVLVSSVSESISGTAKNQKEVNIENKAAIEKNTADILNRLETALIDGRTLEFGKDGKLRTNIGGYYKNASTVILDGSSYVNMGRYGGSWTLPNGRVFLPGEVLTIEFNCEYWKTHRGTVTRTVKSDGTMDNIVSSTSFRGNFHVSFNKNLVSFWIDNTTIYSGTYTTTVKITAKFDFNAIPARVIPIDSETLGINETTGNIQVLDKGITFPKLSSVMVAQSVNKTTPSTSKVVTEKAVADAVASISMGRIISLWDCTTGKPSPNPSEMPYTYKNGDYYIVKKVAEAGGTNYMPDGTEYTGAASTKVETEEIHVGDFYHYNGSEWAALINGDTLNVDGTTIVKDSNNVMSTSIGGSIVETPEVSIVLNEETVNDGASPLNLGSMKNEVLAGDKLSASIQTPSETIVEEVNVSKDAKGLFVNLKEDTLKLYFESNAAKLYNMLKGGDYAVTLNKVSEEGTETKILEYTGTTSKTYEPLNLGTLSGTVAENDTIHATIVAEGYFVDNNFTVGVKTGIMYIDSDDYRITFNLGSASLLRTFPEGTYNTNINKPAGTTVTPIDMRVVKVDNETIVLNEENELKALVQEVKADNKTITYDEDANLKTAIGGWEIKATSELLTDGAFTLDETNKTFDSQIQSFTKISGGVDFSGKINGVINAGWEGKEVSFNEKKVTFVNEGDGVFKGSVNDMFITLYPEDHETHAGLCKVTLDNFDAEKSNVTLNIIALIEAEVHPIESRFVPVSSEEGNKLENRADGLFVPDSTPGGILIKKVSSDDTELPTQRPDGSALKTNDYVEPQGTLPFTIEGITFNSLKDKAEWDGTAWVYKAYVPQDTLATPLNNATAESISGTSTNQKEVNIENKTAIMQNTFDIGINKTAIAKNTSDIAVNKEDILKRLEKEMVDGRTLVYDTSGKLKASCGASYKAGNTDILNQTDYLTTGHQWGPMSFPNGRKLMPGETITIYYKYVRDGFDMERSINRTVKADGSADMIQHTHYSTLKIYISSTGVYYEMANAQIYSGNWPLTIKVTANSDFNTIAPVCIPVDFSTIGVNSNTNGYIYVLDKGITFPKLADAMIAQTVNKVTPSTSKVATEKAVAEAVASISMGRIVSLWDCTTGKPSPNPSEMPYTYQNGDYYIVKKVAEAGGTNYMPDGTEYTGAASTKVETEEIHVGDFYHYNGTEWAALINGDTLKVDGTTIVKDSNNVMSTSIGGSIVETPEIPIVLNEASVTSDASPVTLGLMKNDVQVGYNLAINIQTASETIAEEFMADEDAYGLFASVKNDTSRIYFESGAAKFYKMFPDGDYAVTLYTFSEEGTETKILEFTQSMSFTREPIDLGAFTGTIAVGDYIHTVITAGEFSVDNNFTVENKSGVLCINIDDYRIAFNTDTKTASFSRTFEVGTYNTDIKKTAGATITPIDMRVVKIDNATIVLNEENELKAVVQEVKADNKTIIYDDDANLKTAIGGWEEKASPEVIADGVFSLDSTDNTFISHILSFKTMDEGVEFTAKITGFINQGWEGNEVFYDGEEFIFSPNGDGTFTASSGKLVITLYPESHATNPATCKATLTFFDTEKSNATLNISIGEIAVVHTIESKFIPVSSKEGNKLINNTDGLFVSNEEIDEQTIVRNSSGKLETAVGGYVTDNPVDILKAEYNNPSTATSPVYIGPGMKPITKGETVYVAGKTPRGNGYLKCTVEIYQETYPMIDLSSAAANTIVIYNADKGYYAIDTTGKEFEAGLWSISISTTEIENIHKIDPRFYDNVDVVFDIIYPVGSVYVSVGTTLPSSFRGTWERLNDDYYLVSSSSGQGKLVGEQLPNITGVIPSARSGCQFGAFDSVSGVDPNTNPFYVEPVIDSDYCVQKNEEDGNSRIRFDLSRYSNVYVNGGKVQPKSIKCSMWKRTL